MFKLLVTIIIVVAVALVFLSLDPSVAGFFQNIKDGFSSMTGKDLGVELFPIPLPMHELVADDVGLEDARVLEERHVTGKDVANAHGEGHQDLGEAEAPDLAAGQNPLARDGGDGGGEPGVDLSRQLLPGSAAVAPSRVDAARQGGDLFPTGLLGLGHQEIDVRAELHLEVDPPHVPSGGPVLHLIRGEAHTLDAMLGPAFTREFGETQVSKAEGFLGVDYTWAISEKQSFSVNNGFFIETRPSAGPFRNFTRARWSLALLDRPKLSLNLGVDNEYESRPEEGDEPNDLTYLVSLGIDL